MNEVLNINIKNICEAKRVFNSLEINVQFDFFRRM